MTTDIKTFKRLWRYLRPYWRLELVTFIAMVLIAGVTLAIPLAIQYMIDDLIPSLGAADQFELKPIVLFGLALVAIYFFNVLFTYIRDNLIGRISAGIVRDIRSDLFYHLEQVSLRFHHRKSVGELMSRILSDVDRVQELLTSVPLMFFANILMLAAILVYLLQVNWVLTLVALIPVPVTILLPELTNEVQHLYKVLLWEKNTINSTSKNGVKYPDFIPRAVRTGKSLQLWIARHRQLLES